MSYLVYKNLHLLGIFMVLVAYGCLLGRIQRGAPMQKLASATHGIGLLISFIAGFGMLAKLGIHWPFPGWVIGKALIWVFLAGGITLVRRRPDASGIFWWAVIGAAFVASWLALSKPF